MAALYIVGDVFDRVAELRRRRVQASLVLCSPPFLALRSYLPNGHPLKGSEIGSEATPAAFIDVMLALVAELGHVLAPWGSLAFELGDTYAGSGGAGGDYNANGMRDLQPRFAGSGSKHRMEPAAEGTNSRLAAGPGWPLDKSLAGIPQAFMLSLAYGYNVLDRRGPDSPAGRWRVRNVKPWIRSNPPVGALGDKERPATSYVTVATRDPGRYFDLDAVRTAASPTTNARTARGVDARPNTTKAGHDDRTGGNRSTLAITDNGPAGAPPRDWWHHVDGVLDACLDDMAGKVDNYERRTNGTKVDGRDGVPRFDSRPSPGATGARGVHLRRALERAGILATVDALDVSPKGYKGAHYAVWPPELVRLLIAEMCPQRVCATCGQPSRRVNGALTLDSYRGSARPQTVRAVALADAAGLTDEHIAAVRAFGTSDAGKAPTLNNGEGKNTEDVKRLAAEAKAVLGGYFREFVQSTTAQRSSTWTDCEHDTWEPGLVLDPFVGSGTTLEVASGMGRRAIGIDLDYTNVGLALERVGGLFLDVEWPDPDLTLLALGAGPADRGAYDRWRPMLAERGRARCVALPVDHLPCPRPVRDQPIPSPSRPKRRAVSVGAGQMDLLTPGG